MSMKVRPWDFLVLLTLAAAASPAQGQALAPTTRGGTQSAASVPDFPLGEWVEYVCAENKQRYGTGKDPAIPTAYRPDF